MARRLVLRSTLVLTLLFGLLYAVGTALLYKFDLPLTWAVGFSVGVVALQYLLGPYLLGWFFNIQWVEPREVSPALEVFLQDLCRRRGIPVPRFGIIEDGTPNAFTFGHLPSNARVVVTRGLVDMLTQEELHAVVAHELGHVAHYDFLVMALASVVPLILYQAYAWTRRDKKPATFLVALGAYAAYVLSQMGVLVLSRLREFFADEHAVESVADANAISRALVKIAYGMAVLPQEAPKKKAKDQAPQEQPSRVAMVGALGISEMKASGTLAMVASSASGAFSAERMGQAMRWDLWNPWAAWYELFSTHPLVARRVAAASELAVRRGQTPLVAPVGPAPANRWPPFFRDLGISYLPWIGAAVGLCLVGPFSYFAGHRSVWGALWDGGPRMGPILLLGGLGWALSLAFSYAKPFEPRTVSDLVSEWDVSAIKGIPAELKGTIIGRGIPGLLWSKDLVVQDETGFITLLYQQPFGFMETLFGLLRAESLIGREVTVRGWFRRGPGPFFEADQLFFEDGSTLGCYYRHAQWVLASLGVTLGAWLVFF